MLLGLFTLAGCSGETEDVGTPAPTSGGIPGVVPEMDTALPVDAQPGVGNGIATPSEPSVPASELGNPAQPATSSSSSASATTTSTVAVPEMAPPQDEPSAGFVRRLTHIEFDNTVSDLFDIDATPSSGLAADVALQGFTNNSAGQNVTPTLAEQYIEVVEGLSRQVTTDLKGLLGCDPAALGEEACVEQFIADFGRRAWRRPLTMDEQTRALELFRTARTEYELNVSAQMLVQFFLLSPHFLYLVEPLPANSEAGSVVPLDSWKVASRLSYFLLGTTPDAELLDAAESGALDTPEAVATQARRLLETPRARQRVGLFFTEWLRLRHIDKLQKDSTMFPDFDLSLGQLLREQVEQFAQAVILDDDGTAADLLTAPFTFVNDRLAPIYGVSGAAGATLTRVELDPTQRAGLLTHAAILAMNAHQDQTDPVVRGKFIRESVLCDSVPPPPVDLIITPPVITPGSTTRERFAQHQTEAGCRGCHTLMDPIGLGFEHYDPIGQWRDMDNELEIDATGEVVGTDVAGTFDGAIELSNKLADSEQVMACLAKTWMRFALGRSEQDADEGALAVVGEKFESSGFKMTELLVALTETNAFRYQRVLDADVSALMEPAITATEEETP